MAEINKKEEILIYSNIKFVDGYMVTSLPWMHLGNHIL